MRKNLIWLVVLAAAVLSAVLAGFDWPRKNEPRYFTATVERGDIHDVVDSTGTINAVTTVLVGSQVSGTIAKLGADFNSRVRKGQVIAEIDPSLFRGALLQAKADLNSAKANVAVAQANLEKAQALLVQTKADYDRAINLESKNFIAMQQVDLSKSNYNSALATVAAARAATTQAEAQVQQKAGAVEVARTNLEYTVIHSPIDGTVVARNVDVGQTVAASLQAPTLFTIAKDLTKMQVYAKIDETNVGKVKLGRRVNFKVDAFPKDTFHGVVSQVRMNPTIVQNVVNYDAMIDFDNPELKLFPGMTAYVTIPVADAGNVLKIANVALRYTPQLSPEQVAAFQKKFGVKPNERAVVWKLRADGTVDPVKLALGITDHSYTALVRVEIGELAEGDNLVTGDVPTKNQVTGPPGAGRPTRR